MASVQHLDMPLTMEQDKKLDILVSVRPIPSRMLSNDSTKTNKYRDSSDDDTESQVSTASSLDDAEAGRSRPKWHRRARPSSLKHWLSNASPSKSARRQKCCRWTLMVLAVLGVFGIIAGMLVTPRKLPSSC